MRVCAATDVHHFTTVGTRSETFLEHLHDSVRCPVPATGATSEVFTASRWDEGRG